MSACRKSNLLLAKSIYLVILLYKAKKTHTYLGKIQVFLLFQIEKTHKPSKIAPAKKNFSSEYVVDATWFREGFLFYVITVRHYLLQKYVVTFKNFFQPPYCCSI